MKSVLVLSMLLGSGVAFAHEKPIDVPACAKLKAQCEPNYMPGDHKKNGKGFWFDCVRARASGKDVPGVTATQAEAQACQDAAKAQRAENKAEKKK